LEEQVLLSAVQLHLLPFDIGYLESRMLLEESRQLSIIHVLEDGVGGILLRLNGKLLLLLQQ